MLGVAILELAGPPAAWRPWERAPSWPGLEGRWDPLAGQLRGLPSRRLGYHGAVREETVSASRRVARDVRRRVGDTGEKTEEASPEKLRKAQEEGQVPKSQDFVGALNFAVGFMTLAALSTYVAGELKDYTLAAFDAATRAPTLASIFKMMVDRPAI